MSRCVMRDSNARLPTRMLASSRGRSRALPRHSSQHVNVSWATFGDVDTMALTSLAFSSVDHRPHAAFSPLHANAWQRACNGSGGNDRPGLSPYSPDCAVSLVSLAGEPAVQCAMTEMTGVDPLSLRVTAAPIVPQGQLGAGPQGTPACPASASGAMPCPEFMAPEHLITDAATGDVFGIVYIWRPTPAYRLYRIPAGTKGPRQVIAEIPAAAGGPMYMHHNLMLTPSYYVVRRRTAVPRSPLTRPSPPPPPLLPTRGHRVAARARA